MEIKVTNFGPITKGFDTKDGFMEISKVTVFLGTQGSGKSTIIKLISTFSYIEKSLINERITSKELTYSKIVNNFFSWHSIENFIKPETEIIYQGSKYRITFLGNKTKPKVESINNKFDNSIDYVRPKICYIPAERNFCSAIPQVESIAGILKNVYAIISDFAEASNLLANQELALPLEEFKYKYNSSSKKKTVITDTGESILLNEAASGLQSLIPMAIVNSFYSNPTNAFSKKSIAPISTLQKNKLSNHIFNTISDLKISSIFPILWHLKKEPDYDFMKEIVLFLGEKEPKSSVLKTEALNNGEYRKNSVYLRKVIHETIKSCLLSLVEEPEQNLFPNSQKLVLESLIKNVNCNINNKLVLTTHSAYILGSINNCLYAGYLKTMKKIVPSTFEEKIIYPESISAYYIFDGEIKSAINYDDNLPQINHGLIDSCSKDINSAYEELCNLEFSK